MKEPETFSLTQKEDATLAQATLNKHWGVGLKLSNDAIATKNKWKGKNVLGEILMTVRTELKK